MNQQQATLPFGQRADKDFSQFIGNHKTVETLQHVEQLPAFVYILGDDFSGKTHVLKALESKLNKLNAVNFAVDAKQLTEVDVSQIMPVQTQYLLVDDVDNLSFKISGQKSAEVALFNIFNHCKANHIKLIVTAAIHAKSSQWQLPDLISRLNSGLSLSLEVLQGNEALECFAGLFKLNSIPLDPAVLHYLQTHHSSNFSDLYQLFIQVSVESLKLKRKVTVPLVKQVMQVLSQINLTQKSEI